MAFSLSKNKNVKIESADLMCSELFLDSSIELESVNHRRGMRKSRYEGANTRTIETSAPFDDGYQWRKYGTKKISSSNYPRSYFRCTYRDDRNCRATKQVQQKDFTDPPVFIVTYSNSHSCNSTCMPDAILSIQSGSSMKRTNLINYDFSEGSRYQDQKFSAFDSKPCQNRLNLIQDVHFPFQDTTSEFRSVESQIVDSHEPDAMFQESLPDYSTLQEFDELDGLDDFILSEYMNSSDMNLCG